MDDSGNILIKRIAKSNIYVKNTEGETAVANEIIKTPGGALELDKPVKLFDMKKFQQNVARELKRAYPDRRKLECQVISNKSPLFQLRPLLCFSAFRLWRSSKTNQIFWNNPVG